MKPIDVFDITEFTIQNFFDLRNKATDRASTSMWIYLNGNSVLILNELNHYAGNRYSIRTA